MKKSILFLLGLSLLTIVSCSKDEKDIPTVKENTTLEKVVKEFKFLGEDAKLDNVAESAKADLNAWVMEYNAIPTTPAKDGKAGKLGKRYVNAKGVETIQLLKKGLIGALQLNGFNTALMAGVQAKDATLRKSSVDKAVKYILGNYDPAKPKSKDDFKAEGNAFGKYMMSVAGSTKFKGIDKLIYKAIKDAKDNAENPGKYNMAVMMLNKYVTTVVAFRGVHYMAGYGEKIRQNFDGESVHELSEGLGFAYSLQFAYTGSHKPPFFQLTPAQAKKFADVNLWDEAKDKSGNSFLDQQSKKIAKMFEFTVADAK